MQMILDKLNIICEHLGCGEKKKRISEDEYIEMEDEDKDKYDAEMLAEEESKEE